MSCWDGVREMVYSVRRRDESWLSQKRAMKAIVDFAEMWEIDPKYAEKICLSNWSVIIPTAKQLIKDGNRDRLMGLFRLAATRTNAELRLLVTRPEREAVLATVDQSGYHLDLTQEQFERVQRSTKANFIYAVMQAYVAEYQ